MWKFQARVASSCRPRGFRLLPFGFGLFAPYVVGRMTWIGLRRSIAFAFSRSWKTSVGPSSGVFPRPPAPAGPPRHRSG